MNDGDLLAVAREVFRIESESIAVLADRLDGSFAETVRRIVATTGRVVVSGIGKSGLVARKIASTMSSTGTPALFMHPVEGAHGDVGVLIRGDLLILVSRSGESQELDTLMPAVRRLEIPVVALTGEPRSTLARKANLVLDVSVREEACPHDLSPTSSSSAAMAMGDALAMALLQLRGFDAEDFALLHPGGALGRRLLLRVEDVMVTEEDELPAVSSQATLAEAMREIAHKRGTVPVVSDDRVVIGVITAGDLTRFAAVHSDYLERPVEEAMNRDPKTLETGSQATDALEMMEAHGVMAVPVVDRDGRLRGIVHLHDLLRGGVR
jgi:arabinose-5-phosphate isomerase